MLRLALALSLVFALGCDKSGSPAGEAAAAETAAKAVPAETAPEAEKTAIAAAPEAPEATGEDPASCGGMEDGEAKAACGGEGEAGGCGQWEEAAAEVAKREAPADAVWTTFDVQGMHCGN